MFCELSKCFLLRADALPNKVCILSVIRFRLQRIDILRSFSLLYVYGIPCTAVFAKSSVDICFHMSERLSEMRSKWHLDNKSMDIFLRPYAFIFLFCVQRFSRVFEHKASIFLSSELFCLWKGYRLISWTFLGIMSQGKQIVPSLKIGLFYLPCD